MEGIKVKIYVDLNLIFYRSNVIIESYSRHAMSHPLHTVLTQCKIEKQLFWSDPNRLSVLAEWHCSVSLRRQTSNTRLCMFVLITLSHATFCSERLMSTLLPAVRRWSNSHWNILRYGRSTLQGLLKSVPFMFLMFIFSILRLAVFVSLPHFFFLFFSFPHHYFFTLHFSSCIFHLLPTKPSQLISISRFVVA